MNLNSCFTLLALTTSLITAHGSEVSRLIPFQGRLSDANGNPVSDGTTVIQFKIYDAPVGGRAVWNGEVQKLTVNGALVSTILGSKADLSKVDFDTALYLELTIDANGDEQITPADPPLLPRQSILPAVFAKESADSRKLDGFDWSSLLTTNNPETGKLEGRKIADKSITSEQIGDAQVTAAKLAPDTSAFLIPRGGIIMWSGTTLPTGWALCDGINGRPNLKDRFILGTDTLANVGSTGGSESHRHGAGLLSIPDHTHNLAWFQTGGSPGDLNFIEEGLGFPDLNRPNATTGMSHGNRLPVQGDTDITSVLPPFYRLAFIIKL